MPRLSDITEQLLAAAQTAGAESADAIAMDGTSVSIDVRDGALEQAERAEGVDIGLRVLIGHQQACVSASDVSFDTMSAMAERAVAMAKEAPEDPFIGLASPDQLASGWDADALELVDPSPEPSPAELESAARTAEAAALAINGVSKIDSASATYGRREIHLATTNGFTGGYARGSHSVSCVAITGDGTDMERDYYADGRVFRSDLETPDHIGRMAGARAVSRAGAKRPPTGAFPVLFDERIASGLIGHLLQTINGSSVARGSSWLLDQIGQEILPPALSLIEDPSRKRVSGSRPFDGEGLPVRRRAIIENGVLTGWTLDLATARKLGLESTGNASRGTSSPPSPTTGNVALTEGSHSKQDLLRDMGTGILVTSMIGASINPTTGDYSRGASGFWVENGEITYPVNECTLAGNLREMLRSIVPANDARQHLSRVVPSLLVEGLTLAGN